MSAIGLDWIGSDDRYLQNFKFFCAFSTFGLKRCCSFTKWTHVQFCDEGSVDVWFAAHDNDVRSSGPGGGVSSHGEPVWNGLPRAEYTQAESIH